MLVIAVGFVVAVMLVRSCRDGQRLTGEASEQIQSIEEVPMERIVEFPELAEHLSRAEPPLTFGDFIDLDCAQIVDDDIQHLIYTEDADCPAVVLSHALGFDMVLYYTDAACQYPPTFEAQKTQNRLHLKIDKGRDRGNCDSIGLLVAQGIRLANQPAEPD